LTRWLLSCMITKVIAVEKILEQTLLYDFYGELLTEHQQKIYEDVVFNDISCSEVAENQGISRRPQLSHSTISPLADVTRLSTADGSDILQPLHWLLISRASGGVMRFLIS